jgi:hypothetical protein
VTLATGSAYFAAAVSLLFFLLIGRMSELHEVPGHGVKAQVNGRKVRIGRRSWDGDIAAGAIPQGHGTTFAVAREAMALTSLSERLRDGVQAMLTRHFRARPVPHEHADLSHSCRAWPWCAWSWGFSVERFERGNMKTWMALHSVSCRMIPSRQPNYERKRFSMSRRKVTTSLSVVSSTSS